MNLHSTMVLFKSFISRSVSSASISFTFHYGPIQMPNDEYENDYIALFTFHYGPIQMMVTTDTEYFVDGFTFHYGPIQIHIVKL